MMPRAEIVKEAVRIVCGLALICLAAGLTASQGHTFIAKICVWISLLILLSPGNPAPSRARLYLFARIGLLCNVFALLTLTLFKQLLVAKGWYESPQMMGLFSKLQWLLDPLPTLLQYFVTNHNLGVKIFPEYQQIYFVGSDYGNLLLQIVATTLGLSSISALVRRAKGRDLTPPRKGVEETLPMPGRVEAADVEQFDLYFQGECLAGRSAEQVGEELRKAFKLAPEKIPQLFSGKRLIIKKGVSRPVAEHYHKIFKVSGAVLCIRKSAAPSGGNVPDPVVPTSSPPLKRGFSQHNHQRQTRMKTGRSKLSLLWVCGLVVLLFLGFGLFQSGVFEKLSSAGPAYPKHFVGSWSNQQDEFKTLNLGLHSDGRGTLSTAMFPMIVRWETTDEGINLRATMPSLDAMGETVDYRLSYDESRNELLLQGEKRTERLVKVSEEQPEDLEKQIEEAILKRKQQMDAAHTVTVTALDRSELMAKLGELVASESYFKIRHQEEGWHFRVDKLSAASLMLATTVKSMPALSRTTMRYRHRSENIPAGLKSIFELNASKVDRLLTKARQAGFEISEHNLVGKSIWDIEEYLGHLVISGIDTDEALLDLTKYLLTETFADSSGMFEVELLDKSARNPSVVY